MLVFKGIVYRNVLRLWVMLNNAVVEYQSIVQLLEK